jgi:hypothetical protein
VKRTGRSESTGTVIHICMGMTQGTSLCSYFFLSQLSKMSCFLFYLLYFFFYNIREQEGRTVFVGTGRKGEVVGKEVGG